MQSRQSFANGVRVAVLLLAGVAAASGAEATVAARLAARTFPSVFMAWSTAEHTADTNRLDNFARHDWYPFWDRGLGRPLSAGSQRADGAWERPFENGLVCYNPAGGRPVTLVADRALRSRATGRTATQHAVPPGDGDILEGQPQAVPHDP